MLVKELIEILNGHDPEGDLRIAANRLRPYQSLVRGVVALSNKGTVFLCADEISQPINEDPWQELDGPLPLTTIDQ